jgi:hypothetical protein
MEKVIMRTNLMLNSNRYEKISRYLLVNLTATLILMAAQPGLAQSQQKTFASAEQASQALYDAVRSEDNQAVEAILGSAELTSSGNDDEDKLEREHFAKKYDEMHRLVREPDGSTVLYVGAENWPFPVPLVQSNSQWRFDPDSGSLELRAREIGENEAAAIQVSQAVGKVNPPEANKADADGTVVQFARDLVSSENAGSATKAFHGYSFRILKGKSGETLLVAYPVEYGTSGVMTFVLARGNVYEKDLGPQTATAAQKIQRKPTAKWKQVQWTEPN